MDRHRLAIVIPALNESATVRGVVEAVSPYGTAIIVDDGSTDDTARIAREAGAQVLSHGQNRGYDAALSTGCLAAAEGGFDYVVTMDADGQHNPGQLAGFVQALQGGAWLVAGSRDRKQRISEKIFGLVAKACWGIPDPLCGMKGYRTEAIRNKGAFDTYGSIGTEMALWISRRGYPVAIVPVQTRDRLDAPRFGRVLSANLKILRALCVALVRN